MDKQRVPNRDVNAAQRASQALALRSQRLTYEEIAHRCGYGSASAARKAIQRELNRHVIGNVDELRAEEGHALDQLQAVLWPLAVPGNSDNRDEQDENESDAPKKKRRVNFYAIDRILMIMERRAKLFGLDAVKDANVAMAQVVVREAPPGYFGETNA